MGEVLKTFPEHTNEQIMMTLTIAGPIVCAIKSRICKSRAVAYAPTTMGPRPPPLRGALTRTAIRLAPARRSVAGTSKSCDCSHDLGRRPSSGPVIPTNASFTKICAGSVTAVR